MDLVTPAFGLFVWMLVSFGTVFFILAKFGWPVILKAMKAREKSIEEALEAAQVARDEMSKLKSDNQKILDEAKLERSKIIQEGKELKEKIILEAKEIASREANDIIQQSHQQIENEKNAAIGEIRKQVAELSVAIAEKLLRQKMSDNKQQQDYIDALIREMKIN